MEVLSNGTLRFNQVRWYYAGQYACVAENPGGITMFHVHVKIHEVLRTYIWISMIYGAVLSIGFFIIAMIYASLKLLVEKTCLRQRMKEKADSIISSIEDIEPPSTPLFEGYLSPAGPGTSTSAHGTVQPSVSHPLGRISNLECRSSMNISLNFYDTLCYRFLFNIHGASQNL